MGGYDPAHAGRLGRPADGAEVLRILQAVEHQQHGIRPLSEGFARHRLELPVLPRTDIGDHALGSLRVSDVVELVAVGPPPWTTPGLRPPPEAPSGAV